LGTRRRGSALFLSGTVAKFPVAGEPVAETAAPTVPYLDVCPTRIERRTMMFSKLRIALAATILALAAVSAVDSASAEFPASADEQRNQFISAVDRASTFPEGRRLVDDVVDIELRVIAGP
jgi:hypothetical protein